MFDTSRLGQSFPSFTYQLSPIKIDELTTAIGDSNPVYHDLAAAQQAGFSAVPLSPTSPTLLHFWGNTKRSENLQQLGINIAGILHGEEEYEYLAPIYANDSVTGTCTLLSVRTQPIRNSHTIHIIVMETRYVNQYDQHVLTARSTIVVRERQ
jgi:acyl dehydratase